MGFSRSLRRGILFGVRFRHVEFELPQLQEGELLVVYQKHLLSSRRQLAVFDLLPYRHPAQTYGVIGAPEGKRRQRRYQRSGRKAASAPVSALRPVPAPETPVPCAPERATTTDRAIVSVPAFRWRRCAPAAARGIARRRRLPAWRRSADRRPRRIRTPDR